MNHFVSINGNVYFFVFLMKPIVNDTGLSQCRVHLNKNVWQTVLGLCVYRLEARYCLPINWSANRDDMLCFVEC